jgi:hypothetical protein
MAEGVGGHGADARLALAAVLGMPAEDIRVRESAGVAHPPLPIPSVPVLYERAPRAEAAMPGSSHHTNLYLTLYLPDQAVRQVILRYPTWLCPRLDPRLPFQGRQRNGSQGGKLSFGPAPLVGQASPARGLPPALHSAALCASNDILPHHRLWARVQALPTSGVGHDQLPASVIVCPLTRLTPSLVRDPS